MLYVCDQSTVNSEISARIKISLQRHIDHVKNSQLGLELITSVNGRDFSFSRGVYFRETSHPRSLKKT